MNHTWRKRCGGKISVCFQRVAENPGHKTKIEFFIFRFEFRGQVKSRSGVAMIKTPRLIETAVVRVQQTVNIYRRIRKGNDLRADNNNKTTKTILLGSE